MPNPLTKKVGPLPLWGWMLGAGLGIFLYYRSVASGGSAAAPAVGSTAGAPDPSAVDPNTGLTYGQEENAALGGGGSLGSTTGSTTDTGGGSGNASTGSPLDLTGGFDTQITGLGQVLTDFATVADQLGYGPAAVAAANAATGTANTAAANAAAKAKTATDAAKAAGKKEKKAERGQQTLQERLAKATAAAAKKTSEAAQKNNPKKSSTHRAPAHPNENTHAQAATHIKPGSASQRVKVRKPAKPKTKAKR